MNSKIQKSGEPWNMFIVSMSLLVIGFIFFSYLSRNELALVFARGNPPIDRVIDYGHASPSNRSWKRLMQGEHFTFDDSDRIVVDAQQNGWIGVSSSIEKKVFTVLNVTAYREGYGLQEIFIRDLATNAVQLLSIHDLLIRRHFNLTRRLEPGHDYLIGLQNKGNGKPGRSLVSEFSVEKFTAARNFPYLPTFIAGQLMIFLLLNTAAQKNEPHQKCWLMGAALNVILALAASEKIGILSNPWIWTTEAAALIGYRIVEEHHRRLRAWSHEPLILAVLIGLILRWECLSGTVDLPFVGGDDTYVWYGTHVSLLNPFATDVREPLFVWIQLIVKKLLGGRDIHYRLSTLFFSMATIPATYLLAANITTKRLIGFLAALFIAVDDFAVSNSIAAFRNDVYMFFVVLFCWLAVRPPKKRAKEELLLGLESGLTGLVWIIGLIGCSIVYVWRSWKFSTSAKNIFLFCATVFMLIAPHLWYQWKANGDPLFPVNSVANYYREADAQTKAPQINWIRFISKEEGAAVFVRDLLKGYADLFLNPNNFYNQAFLRLRGWLVSNYLMFPWLLLGFMGEIRAKRAVLFIMTVAFLNVMPAYLSFPRHARIYIHAAPFFSIFCAIGMGNAIEFIARRIKKFATAINRPIIL